MELKYFIENSQTGKWWIPVLVLDEETKVFKITSGWTNDPHHPQVGYLTREDARAIIDKLLSDISHQLFVGEHGFMDMSGE